MNFALTQNALVVRHGLNGEPLVHHQGIAGRVRIKPTQRLLLVPTNKSVFSYLWRAYPTAAAHQTSQRRKLVCHAVGAVELPLRQLGSHSEAVHTAHQEVQTSAV